MQKHPVPMTEQENYLTKNLANPLIEALAEIARQRPSNPILHLKNFLDNYIDKNDDKNIARNSSVLMSDANLKSPQHKIDNTVKNSVLKTDDQDVQLKFERDEHGQSMLHFACTRPHRRGGLLQLIETSNIDITYRDELYRTARDVSLQANQPANAKEIDKYILSMAVVGDTHPFDYMVMAGYDHIFDIINDDGKTVLDIATERHHDDLLNFLRKLRSQEESREEFHQMIRDNNFDGIKEITSGPNADWLLQTKNYYGRTALHIAILKESEEITEYITEKCPDTLKIGDNLERTALHYAMGTNSIEALSSILIQRGAKRITKDLKGRQPSYYFMNKADILRLQEEELEMR